MLCMYGAQEKQQIANTSEAISMTEMSIVQYLNQEGQLEGLILGQIVTLSDKKD